MSSTNTSNEHATRVPTTAVDLNWKSFPFPWPTSTGQSASTRVWGGAWRPISPAATSGGRAADTSRLTVLGQFRKGDTTAVPGSAAGNVPRR